MYYLTIALINGNIITIPNEYTELREILNNLNDTKDFININNYIIAKSEIVSIEYEELIDDNLPF